MKINYFQALLLILDQINVTKYKQLSMALKYMVTRGGHRVSARGGGEIKETKLFQELGTNLKKKERNSRKKGTKIQK